VKSSLDKFYICTIEDNLMANMGVREWLAAGRAIAEGNLVRYSDSAHFVVEFESRLAKHVGTKHVLTVNAGTSALICCLAAAGIGPGDEVLVPAYTWLATPAAVAFVGAVPILVDINDTLTMDPIDLERKITPFTKAVIPVHMGNLPCAMDEIVAIAQKYQLLVVEDACQAVGVRYKNKFCGALGDLGAFSFNKLKNMNIGEGGAVLTSNDMLFTRALNFHDLGTFTRNHTHLSAEAPFIGMNMKVTEIQGAMLSVQLAKLGPLMARLRRRFDLIESILARSTRFRIAPHNDRPNAVSLYVTFPREEEAIDFANQRGVIRLLDNSKHIYTNWKAILGKRSFNPKMNPWEWAQRPIHYDVDMCAKTLEILSRTCRINLGERYPLIVVHQFAKRLSR
jgi:dTDP-4-amino-4,6-dideoxygalactose transaminase